MSIWLSIFFCKSFFFKEKKYNPTYKITAFLHTLLMQI
jgi:hypothetical protein